jgi:hypothetical protein
VESANKVVQQVLKSISSENRLQSKEVNWTKLLGQVMTVCNSHSGIQKNSVSSYEAVFGQKYHQQLQFNLSEMRECKSIFQRLKLSPNEQLQTYVREHHIVDIEVEDTDYNNDNDDDSDKNEGEDLDENAFPDAGVFDGTSTSVEAPETVVVAEASVPTLTGVNIEGDHGGGGTVTGSDGGGIGYFSRVGSGGGSGIGLASGISSVDVSTMAVEAAATGVTSVAMAAIKDSTVRNTPPLSNLTPTCQLTFDSPQPVVNKPSITELETFRASEYSTFTVQEAWDHGNIARLYETLSSREEFKFLWPRLTCRECTFPHHKPFIQIGDEDYMASMTNTTNWYHGVFMSSFSQLAAHYAHITKDERPSLPLQVKLPILLHITHPMEFLQEGQYKSVPQGITKVVAVTHNRNHYGVLEIDIPNKRVVIYDGLYRDLDRWMDYVFSAMKRFMLCDLQIEHLYIADKLKIMTLGRSRHPKMSIEGYTLTIRNTDKWRFERGHFIKQLDSFNCSPIACTKVLEMFHLTSDYEVNLAYRTDNIRRVVAAEWKKFIQRSQQDLVVRVRERLTLHTPVAEEGYLVLPHHPRSTTHIGDPVIAAATRASAQADIDPHTLCFCYCDSSDMELVRLTCCRQTIHRQCVLAYLCINSQCAYCKANLEHASVLKNPTIDRSDLILPSTMTTTHQTPTGNKRDLQSQLIDRTPLRLADTVRAESQDKKRENQLDQAKKMIKMQGKDIVNNGGAPGAVVTVKV